MNWISKITAFLGQSIDWIGKNISRIKTITVVLLFTLFIISFVSNGCNREQANHLFARVTGLDLQNDILSLRNRTLRDSLDQERNIRRLLEASKARLEDEKHILVKDNKRLRQQLAGIPGWILNMPTDSSYKFLNEIAYPFAGEKKYPLNEPQIKNIHADFLENQMLHGLLFTLEAQLINCELLTSNADSIAFSFKRSLKSSERQKENLSEVVKNANEKAVLYENAYNKADKKKKFWKITSGIGAVIILILAL